MNFTSLKDNFFMLVSTPLAQDKYNIFCMIILQGPTFWFWTWKHWEFQVLLFRWVLYYLFLDLDMTVTQCHVRQNLLSLLKKIIAKIIWTLGSKRIKKSFHGFRCNITSNTGHFSGLKCSTNVWPKKIFSGVHTNSKSFTPQINKIRLIKSLPSRCFRLCSFYIKFHMSNL